MVKILIAENNSELRELYKKILVKNGYVVVEAIDGEQAINIYNKMAEKPDIIIIEHRIPKINGLEVAREIMRRNPTIGILMVTGDPHLDSDNDTYQGIRIKSKPVKMDEFLSEIRNIAQI